jgi:hypothetical protein
MHLDNYQNLDKKMHPNEKCYYKLHCLEIAQKNDDHLQKYHQDFSKASIVSCIRMFYR